MNFLTDYQWFEHEMAVNGLAERLVPSHVAAAASKFDDSIVYIPDVETGTFDVYLVNKQNDVFTEYVCWVSDEFVEDPDLLHTVITYILEAYKGPKSVGENLKKINPHFQFVPYPKKEHQDIYKAMNA